MTKDVLFAEPGETVDALLGRMSDRRIRHLPVCQKERLVGIVSIGDLVKSKISGGQPIITNQPQNQTSVAGTTATFTVGATGAEPLNYQWRSYVAAGTTFTNIPFGTEATLVLTNVQPTTRRFAVVVTDSGGLSATSSPLATLTVLAPPSITLEVVPAGPGAGTQVDELTALGAKGTEGIVFPLD
jgi:CBS domain-containing protein